MAQLALAKMNNENVFQGKYLMTPHIRNVNNIDSCIWAFDKISDVVDSIISEQFHK